MRLALEIGEFAYTDKRVEFKEWGDLKPNTPFGTLPVLTLADGTSIGNQRAAARFIGQACGLYPGGLAGAKIDDIYDACDDLIPSVNSAGKGLPEAEKLKARYDFVESGAAATALAKIDPYIA